MKESAKGRFFEQNKKQNYIVYDMALYLLDLGTYLLKFVIFSMQIHTNS